MQPLTLLQPLVKGNFRALARAISLVENEHPGYENLLAALPNRPDARVVGITGPPGAGKSTLTDRLIGHLVAQGKKIAVLCVDPSSPFNFGAVLGDRIRMSEWYTNPSVYIRSLATRGAMGGLHPKIIEITDLVQAAGFDYVLVETVGVGQSEVEIAGLADLTLVVLVPEAGDEVQTMKAGLMEIADVFVVNKADRPDADLFVRNLRTMLAPAFSNHRQEIPILKTVAATGDGIEALAKIVCLTDQTGPLSERRLWLLTEKTYFIVQNKRMHDLPRPLLLEKLRTAASRPDFNLYQFVQTLLS